MMPRDAMTVVLVVVVFFAVLRGIFFVNIYRLLFILHRRFLPLSGYRCILIKGANILVYSETRVDFFKLFWIYFIEYNIFIFLKPLFILLKIIGNVILKLG